jgi:regulator of sirC expression with transglutaminase-like and TPR domain
MNLPATKAVRNGLSESQRSALLKLLADEDAGVYQAVRTRILASGREVIPWLRPHTLSSDPLLRRRAIDIIHHLEQQEADNRFLAFCVTHGEELDLEQGVWALAQTQYPEINVAAYQALLDNFAAEIRERIAGQAAPMGIIAGMNEYLFKDVGFHGNQENYYDPDNSYFNRVIDRRTGNPISLCALYWLLARRLHLPIVGIGMPGHFVCRYQSSKEAFFIDAFNRGKLLTRADCIKYLQGSGHGFQESFLAPTSPGRALLRMCSNLHQIYSHLELREEMARLQRYLVALAK